MGFSEIQFRRGGEIRLAPCYQFMEGTHVPVGCSNGEDAMMNLTVNGFTEGRVSLLERGSCSTEWILSVQGNKETCGNKITQHCVLGIGLLEE